METNLAGGQDGADWPPLPPEKWDQGQSQVLAHQKRARCERGGPESSFSLLPFLSSAKISASFVRDPSAFPTLVPLCSVDPFASLLFRMHLIDSAYLSQSSGVQPAQVSQASHRGCARRCV